MKKLIIILILIPILIYLILFFTIISHSNNYMYDDINDIDYILVLGCRVLEDGNGSTNLINRLDTALEIANQTDAYIIVSGGQGDDEPIGEAEFMYNYLIEHGINNERIIKEEKSTSTYENLVFSSEYIDDNQTGVIITSSFHIYRTNMLVNRLDIDSYLIPSKAPFNKSYFREVLALVKSYLLDK